MDVPVVGAADGEAAGRSSVSPHRTVSPGVVRSSLTSCVDAVPNQGAMAATTLVDRALIRLSGEDVRGFLQGLVTNDVDLLAPGPAALGRAADPAGQGLVRFHPVGRRRRRADRLRARGRGRLARRLTLYRLRRADRDRAASGARRSTGRRTARGRARSAPAALGRRWLAPRRRSRPTGWLAHRLSLGVTEGRAELGSDKMLWLECNAAELNGVSFAKGCYVGQENTARMN